MTEKKAKPKKKFDPEGSGYDYESQKKAGMKRAANGHLGSRDPKTGLLLKGRKHKTWNLGVNGETEAGYQIKKGKDGRYSSKKSSKVDNSKFLNKPMKAKKKRVSRVQKSETLNMKGVTIKSSPKRAKKAAAKRGK